MFNQILELVRAWSHVGQFFFALIVATAITVMVTVFIGCLFDFLTNGIPKILHGHPAVETEQTNDTDERKGEE